MMLSSWKINTCLAGRSCSHSQDVVIKAETSVCFSKSRAIERSRSWMEPSSSFRWNVLDGVLKDEVVKRIMGHSDPRIEEKCRIWGTSRGSARLSTMTATLDPMDAFRKEGSMLREPLLGIRNKTASAMKSNAANRALYRVFECIQPGFVKLCLFAGRVWPWSACSNYWYGS